MHIFKSANKLSSYLNTVRSRNSKVTIGFVPTMGALHDGHLSLIETSVAENDLSVCSIFVNPTQFGEAKDLDTYPKPIEKDIDLLLKASCNILFLPEVEEVYPQNYSHNTYDLEGIDLKIEGASRPGHFQGVCNVIHRFITIIQPNHAYFGQKDFQQTVVVKKLMRLIEAKTEIKVVPIKRESHGLAMSSRNIRLSKKGRKNAAFIYKALTQLKEDTEHLSLNEAVNKAKQFISAQKGAKLDYLLAVDAETLEQVNHIKEATNIAVVTVVEYEGVRLLDNILLSN